MKANCCLKMHSKFNTVWIVFGLIWCHVLFFEILSVYYIVSVKLLYVVCKGTGYQGQSWLKSKCAY